MMTAKRTETRQVLRIGIFGRTFAGKSEFLYRLLTADPDRVLEKSAAAGKFLSEFRERRSKNQPTSTTSDIEDMSATLLLAGADEALDLRFSDFRGEPLERDVQKLQEKQAGDNLVLKQLQQQQCNAFLFFFDPTSQDRPDRMEVHYKNCLRHVEQFLTYVVPKKGNDCLPILFVLTKRDLWEDGAAGSIQTRVADWSKHATALLNSGYRQTFTHTFPEALLEPRSVVVQVCSTEGEDVHEAVRRLADLARVADAFRRKLRAHFYQVLACLAVVAALLVGGLAFAFLSSRPAVVKNGRNGGAGLGETMTPQEIAGMTPDEVEKRLDELGQLLRAYPDDDSFPTGDDAKEIGEDLAWIDRKLRILDATPAGAPPEFDRTRLEKEQGDLASWVLRRSQLLLDRPSADRRQGLEKMLQQLPRDANLPPPLLEAAENYWLAYRREIVGDLGARLRSHRQVNDAPERTLKSVLDDLETTADLVGSCTVHDTGRRTALVAELDFATTLCHKLLKDRRYSFEVKIRRACLESEVGIQYNRRKLTFQVGDKEVASFHFTVREGQSPYELIPPETPGQVSLPLGDTATLDLWIFSDSAGDWVRLYRKRNWYQADTDALTNPIAMPGVPLLRTSGAANGNLQFEPQLERVLSMGDGYSFELEIGHLPSVPSLLVEAVIGSHAEGEQP